MLDASNADRALPFRAEFASCNTGSNRSLRLTIDWMNQLLKCPVGDVKVLKVVLLCQFTAPVLFARLSTSGHTRSTLLQHLRHVQGNVNVPKRQSPTTTRTCSGSWGWQPSWPILGEDYPVHRLLQSLQISLKFTVQLPLAAAVNAQQPTLYSNSTLYTHTSCSY